MRPPARQAGARQLRPAVQALFNAFGRREKVMRNWKLWGQRLFPLWFGWGLPPVLAGALGISFTESWALGAAAAAVFLAWFYQTGRTSCSRCAYHGTAKCGLPGLIAPLLTPKKSADSLSPERVTGVPHEKATQHAHRRGCAGCHAARFRRPRLAGHRAGASEQAGTARPSRKASPEANCAEKRLVLPLDHGPRAQRTPWLNERRRTCFEAEQKACKDAAVKGAMQ